MRKLYKICLILFSFLLTPFILGGCDSNDDISIRVQDEVIEWSSNGKDWKPLISVDEVVNSIGDDIKGEQGLPGINGKQVEFQKGTTYIQWRYVGDKTWKNLIAISDIKGKDGNNGTNGKDGTDGKDGQDLFNETTPYIGDNEHWWIGLTDTGIETAMGSPTIGKNGNWWIGSIDTKIKSNSKLIFGDIDLSGTVTSEDAELLLNYLNQKTALSSMALKNADLDLDDKITHADHTILLTFLDPAATEIKTLPLENMLYGDVNSDGILDRTDGEIIQLSVVGHTSVSLSPIEVLKADFDKNGILTFSDSTSLIRSLVSQQKYDYKVDFIANGGVMPENFETTYMMTPGTSFESLPVPTYDYEFLDITFDGWYSGSDKFTTLHTVGRDLELYAYYNEFTTLDALQINIVDSKDYNGDYTGVVVYGFNSEYLPDDGNVYIPREILGVPVTKITAGATSTIKNLYLPNTVNSILVSDSSTFLESCENVYIESTNPTYYVKNGYIAEKSTHKLVGVSKSFDGTINNEITSFEFAAFSGCKDVTSIKLPSSLESLDLSCFMGSSIKEIIINNTLKNIDTGLFSKYKLTLIFDSIADSVIGDIGSLNYIDALYFDEEIIVAGTSLETILKNNNYEISSADKTGYIKYIHN